MNTPKEIQSLRENNERGFLGFWIRKYRISYLIVIGLIFAGLMAAIGIPKESQPAVDLDMVVVSTSYPGASPQDMDSLITTKIYNAIRGIEGIKKITSSSSLGISSITITPKTGEDVGEIKDEIENAINTIVLPSDANESVVQEIKFESNRTFSALLYDSNQQATRSELSQKAKMLQKGLESLSSIESVDFNVSEEGGSGDDTLYEAKIVIDEEKMKGFGLSLSEIQNTIQSTNIDRPVGNFELDEKKYDFRIEDKLRKSIDFLNTPIALPKGGYIALSQIATIERKYINDIEQSILSGTGTRFFDGVGLTVNKTKGTSIFAASEQAKKKIEEMLALPEFSGLKIAYTYDLGATITRDYQQLGSSALSTFALVFIIMFLFVGLFDALFATITLPLAFLCTFIILQSVGFSMNFLTNFSLLLSFGIAIDTIVVIVQAANAKLRLGYNPRSAIMLALREYGVPVIAGVSTTIVVFVPMMVLPGMMGKFLAFIPVTIFGVLASGLFLALTVNSAVYLLLMRKRKFYIENENIVRYLSPEDRALLEYERQGKQEQKESSIPMRNKIIRRVVRRYRQFLTLFLRRRYLRRVIILLPIAFFVCVQMFIAPKVDFQMFPVDDNNIATYTIEGTDGITTEEMSKKLGNLDAFFSGFEETDYILKQIKNNTATITLNLIPKEERKAKNMRSIFEIDTIITERLKSLKKRGLTLIADISSSGPPGGHAIGIKLIADEYEKLPELIASAQAMQEKLREIDGVKNISSSSKDTPGQFIFQIDREATILKGISPNLVYNTIISALNGVKVATIEDNQEDIDVLLVSDRFTDNASIDMIRDLPITVGNTHYRVGDFIDIRTKNSIAKIERENGDIQIQVNADVKDGYSTQEITQKALDLAENTSYPSGIRYVAGGENEENSDLIIAMMIAFVTAMVVIFGILTLQFDSFAKPIIILFSVILAFPFVVLGLYLTDNPFSMSFAIGFIAFTGVAVNHGIILIDAVNQNIKRGMDAFTALVEAGSLRLEPMVVTTLTTVLGILPIALQDKFWAGMGFTIVFGLIAATFLTLFITTTIYYELFTREKGNPLANLIKILFHTLKKIILLPLKILFRIVQYSIALPNRIFTRKKTKSGNQRNK